METWLLNGKIADKKHQLDTVVHFDIFRMRKNNDSDKKAFLAFLPMNAPVLPQAAQLAIHFYITTHS